MKDKDVAVHFGSEICGDPASAERREWLISNGLGSYGSGTVAGGLSRSYHGLLVVALGAPADPCSRTLLVAALHDLDPRTIVSFRLEGGVPCWRYAIGAALLEKRLWMQPGAHTTTAHYRLLQSAGTPHGEPLRLEITVLVNARCHHGGPGAAGPGAAGVGEHPVMALQAVPHGVRITPAVPGVPPFLVLSDRGDTTLAAADDWCCGIRLSAEAERGLRADTDHLRACRIVAELCAETPTLSLVASTEVDPPLDGERGLAQRRRYDAGLLAQWQAAWPQLAPRAPAWVRQLVLAADAFLVARRNGSDTGSSVIAGYPWFADWGRDTMISLAGLTLCTGRPASAARILRTYATQLSGGMLPNRFPDSGEPLGEHDYNSVDATLWYVEALRLYHDASGDDALIHDLWPCLQEIIAAHLRGTRHGISQDPADGLLRAGCEGLQLTWMDAKVNGRVITPRIGKPVEVNVLWFCALRTMARFAELCGQGGAAGDQGGASGNNAYALLAEQARAGFQRFWNEAGGCCFDVLDGPDGGHDPAVRPNQLLALALTDQLLSPEQERRLLAVVERSLLTPMGLRSLDPGDPRYEGHYGGGPLERDSAYHQGTVWAWWLGPWARARARVLGSAQQPLQWLEAIGEHLADAGLGSISEIFDGDPPHAARGCIAQAWSVAELLRAWTELSLLERDQAGWQGRAPAVEPGPAAAP